jgi:hypothetical protein
MGVAMSPRHWNEVCTTNEERLFLLALIIEPDKTWRSAEGLARELQWPVESVNEYIDHFVEMGVVVQNPENPKLWGYWEKVQQDSQ